MTTGKDILNNNPELKRMPFSTPEGYFETFRCEPWKQRKKKSPLRALAPYAAMAAMFAMIAIGGAALLEHTATGESDIDSFAFADLIPLTDPDLIYHVDDNGGTSGELTNEDIINYLIYTGVSLESY